MASSEKTPPTYEVFPHDDGPVKTTLNAELGRIGLALLVFITPSFDPEEDLFLSVSRKNHVDIRRLWTVEQTGVIFRTVTAVVGEDLNSALDRLDNTVGDMRSTMNCWQNPVPYEKMRGHPVRVVRM
jgi:hypothetical protein